MSSCPMLFLCYSFSPLQIVENLNALRVEFNFNEEIISGHLVTSETKKFWAVEMELAQKLIEVCDKHNLKVWADAGTLLGAVRHKGFIPWDDDMDFCMMREDYNKLLEIGPQEFKYPFFFQSIDTDNMYGCLVKIRNSNTTMLEKGYDMLKTNNRGCAIDVFVMDVVPDDRVEFSREYKKVRRLRRMVDNYNLINTSKLSGKRKLLNIANRIIVSLLNVNRLQSLIVKTLSKPDAKRNRYISLLDFYATMKYDISKIKVREIQSYNETVYLPFHYLMLPAPKEYHKVLTSNYGNYMIPVKGGALHSMLLIDCVHSYKEVIAELKIKQY